MMPAFRANSQQKVDEVHGAGLVKGWMSKGEPDMQAAYSPDFHVAYLRNPVGNKVTVFCTI